MDVQNTKKYFSCFKLDEIKEKKKLLQNNCDYAYLNKSLIVYFKDIKKNTKSLMRNSQA